MAYVILYLASSLFSSISPTPLMTPPAVGCREINFRCATTLRGKFRHFTGFKRTKEISALEVRSRGSYLDGALETTDGGG